MKKFTYPVRFKKLFLEMIPKYKENIGAGSLSVDVNYMDGNDPCRPNTAMQIHIDLDYLRATITVYPNALDTWRRNGDEEFREMIAHEIAHVATQPMRDLISQPFKSPEEVRIAWEALTTLVGRYIYQDVKRRK